MIRAQGRQLGNLYQARAGMGSDQDRFTGLVAKESQNGHCRTAVYDAVSLGD